MPVNDFEKQVQQKLDELQLRPSPAVWTDVEKQIRKEKKRRRVIIFWWLLPLLLTGAGAGYYFTQVKSSKPTSATQLPTNQKNTAEDTEQNLTRKSNNTQSNILQKEEQQSITGATTPSSTTTATKDEKKLDYQRQVGKDPGQLIVTSQSATLQKKKKNPAANTIADAKPIQEKEIVKVNAPTVTNPEYPELLTSTEPYEKEKTSLSVTMDSVKVTAPVDPPKEVALNEPVTAQTNNPGPIKITRNKWQLGVEFRPGLSNTIDGPLFDGQKSMNLYSQPNSSPGNITSSVPFAPPVLISSPERGFSAALEIFARKSLSKRWEFQGGLQYQYLSTYIEVGSHVASSRQLNNDMSAGIVVDNYYNAPNTGTGNNSYTNQYHLLGISARMSWNIINKKKFLLSWDNGFTYGKLISTNALLFDPTSRSYYQDFNAFKKTQFSLNTGLTFPVWSNKAFTLAIHPFASYTLSPVLKEAERNMQFVNYGVGFKFLLPPKK